MFETWTTMILAVGAAVLGLAVLRPRGGSGNVHKIDALIAVAPAIAIVAVLEFIVVPMWGVKAVQDLMPVAFVGIILPWSMRISRINRHRR
ncbi:MAG TPA: hypothetical protein VM050_11750 [Patescibacteria group bacterium]|nr:hypothetical protein [Patescibacteria group bacterium]